MMRSFCVGGRVLRLRINFGVDDWSHQKQANADITSVKKKKKQEGGGRGQNEL